MSCGTAALIAGSDGGPPPRDKGEGGLGHLPRWFWWAFVGICLAKLVLVSHEEILVYSDDDYGWAYISAGWYWGNPYGPYAYVRQPAYPLFLAMGQALGVPARLGIELLWFVCAGAACAALRRCGLHPFTLVAVAIGVVVHPWFVHLGSRLLVDVFYAPLFLVLVTASTAALVSRGTSTWKWGLVAGVAGAVAANARQESILVWLALLTSGGMVFGLWAVGALNRRAAMRVLVASAVLPMLLVFAMTHAFKLANLRAIGSYVTFDLDMPGYKSLYRALLSIPPDHPDLRLPIPRDVREKAYQASPTFARLRDCLESDPKLDVYRRACKGQTGVDGEFGGWACWALRQAAWEWSRSERTPWRSAGELDAFYARAAVELRDAMREGRLPQRFAPVDFVPPEWFQLAERFPTSLRRCVVQFQAAMPNKRTSLSMPRAEGMFDSAALRRSVTSELAAGRSANQSLWHGRVVSETVGEAKGNALAAGPWVARAGLTGLIAGVLAAGAAVRRRRLHWRWHVLMGCVLAAVLLRVLMTVVLDASGISVQPRYLLAANVLWLIVAAAGLQAAVHIVASLALSGRPGGKNVCGIRTAEGEGHASYC